MIYEYISIEYLIAAISALVLYLIYYVYTKDALYSRNIRSIAKVAEELNREIYYLKQELKETKQTVKDNGTHMSDEDIYQEVERNVYDMIQPLSIRLEQLKDSVQVIDEQIDSRVSTIETGVRQISIPSSIHGNDDEKIISLFKQGVSLDTISKELHISKAEVEFVLKINKIK